MAYKHTRFISCMDALRDLQRPKKLSNEGKAAGNSGSKNYPEFEL